MKQKAESNNGGRSSSFGNRPFEPAGLIVAVLISLCHTLFAQGTLAVGDISRTWPNLLPASDTVRFFFSRLNDEAMTSIYKTHHFTTNDVGRLFVATQATDTNFNRMISVLTNGTLDYVGATVQVGYSGWGIYPLEGTFFSPLPPGGNGIDFSGFHIDNLALQIDQLAFLHTNANAACLLFTARIFVNSLPVIVVTPLAGQTAYSGSAVDFTVRAYGSEPPVYQWFFNGNAITDRRTNGVLHLSSAQASDAGTYTVVLTSPFGAVTSAPTMLNVIAAVDQRLVAALDLTGEMGSSLHVEHAAALGSAPLWLPLDTVTLTNPAQLWLDLSNPLPQQRFYRAWQTGAPGVVPNLTMLSLVPAIALAGNTGDRLRLDYINQVGPINAWFTNLATVTLTSSSQIYCDMSAIGQPQRLYRIVPLP